MKRDIDYVVKDGEVIIVDEFTGRLMYGRRYTDGLHQAIEAKEGVTVGPGVQDSGHHHLPELLPPLRQALRHDGHRHDRGGGVQRAHTPWTWWRSPPTGQIARKDHNDVVYKTEAGKFRAVIRQIEECHEKGQPVLVGTISIEKSELLSAMLNKEGIRHNVLNAKNHEKEAEIVAQAGKFGAVTVATNMAGRGTDIMLGGNAEYLAKADLRKAGMTDELIAEATGFADTDNQEILDARERPFRRPRPGIRRPSSPRRKRCARRAASTSSAPSATSPAGSTTSCAAVPAVRATPAMTRFFLALEDDLMRLFGSERVMGMMETLGVDEDTPIEQQDAYQRHRDRPEASWRPGTSRSGRASWSTTT